MMMSKMNVPQRSRTRSISLVLIMLLSIIASANLVDASIARTYTTNRDPVDIALGDFDCDQDLDMALATKLIGASGKVQAFACTDGIEFPTLLYATT